MPATAAIISHHAFTHSTENKICLSFWVNDPDGPSGLSTDIWLSPEKARAIGKQLVDLADGIPREASAADLGIAA